jgi:hypothetical protein
VDQEAVVHEGVVVEPTTVAARPVAAAPVAAAPVMAEPVVPVVETVQTMPATTVVSRRFWEFDAAAVVTALAGVALLLVGLIAMTRGGFDGSMEEPVVDVVGFSHTTLLGIIEVCAGALLLIAGATKSREGAIFLSTVIAIAACVGAIQAESFQRQLAIEESFAWTVMVLALVVLAVNLIVPSVRSRSTVYARR